MGKGSRNFIPLGIALVLVLALFASWRRSEPAYQGKELSYWLQQYNDAGDIAKFGALDTAVRVMGTNVLPYLFANLTRKDPPLRIKQLYRWFVQHHLVRLPFYAENPFFAPSLMALKALGPAASPMLPGFQKLLENPETASAGENAFLFLGRTGLPALEAACHHTNQIVRMEAALIMGRIKGSQDGSPAWAYSWHSSSFNGKPLLSAGWVSETPDLGTVGGLIEGLDQPNSAVRQASIEVLELVIHHRSTWPNSRFLSAMTPTDREAVEMAREALKKIEPAESAGGHLLKP